MSVWIWLIPILLICVGLAVYIRAEVIITVREDELFRGLIINLNSRFYKMERQYNYTDPRFSLVESLLLSALESRKPHAQEAHISFEESEEFVRLLRGFPVRILFKVASKSLKMVDFILGYTIIENINWVSIVGSRNACYTALQSGACWALKGSLLGLLSSRCRIKKVACDVKPDFINPFFKTTFICILKIRTAHIIFIELYAIAMKVRWYLNGFTARTAESSY